MVDDAQGQRAGQRALGIAHLAGELARLPPAAEGEEGRDHALRPGRAGAAGAPGCRATKGRKRSSCPAPEAKPQDHQQHEHRRSWPRPERSRCPRPCATPVTLTRATSDDRAEGHGLRRRARHQHRGVGPEARGEGGGEAGVHDEQALPAVEESDLRAEGLAQVDVAAARHRVARAELAEAEGAAKRRALRRTARPRAAGRERRGPRPCPPGSGRSRPRSCRPRREPRRRAARSAAAARATPPRSEV